MKVNALTKEVTLTEVEYRSLALTWEDVKNIFYKVRDEQFKYSATEGCYQEVADWFNEQRKK